MLTGNGHVNNHNLSIRGRGGATGYFLSGGFTDQSGFLKNDVYKRYDLRSNLETKVTEWLSFGLERSEEGRVGREGVSTCRSRWSQYHKKKKKSTISYTH